MGWPITIVIISMNFAVLVTLLAAEGAGLSSTPQHLMLLSIPPIVGTAMGLATSYWWTLRRRTDSRHLDPTSRTRRQINLFWGRPLASMSELISLCQKRIALSQAELDKNQPIRWTGIFELLRIGYKCVQTARAIHTLCLQGYPDQALSLCRALMEQEANVWFIMTSGRNDMVAERYVDWESMKFYRYVKKWRRSLDKTGIGPTDEEWAYLTSHYNQLLEKYKDDPGLKRRGGWAIAFREGQPEPIRAYSVTERAKASIPRLRSDPEELSDVWAREWQRLNEFTHTTPRSILDSASSPEIGVVVIGTSSIGIGDPLEISGRALLNISSLLSRYWPFVETPEQDKLGAKTMDKWVAVLEELAKVPEVAWPQRYRQRSEISAGDDGS